MHFQNFRHTASNTWSTYPKRIVHVMLQKSDLGFVLQYGPILAVLNTTKTNTVLYKKRETSRQKKEKPHSKKKKTHGKKNNVTVKRKRLVAKRKRHKAKRKGLTAKFLRYREDNLILIYFAVRSWLFFLPRGVFAVRIILLL